MKQKIVIKVSMPCEKNRRKAMALAASAAGVSSVEITGDKDRLEVVGDGVDSVCLAKCLRRKLGHAEILQVEEVKEKKPKEKKPEEKPDEPKPTVMHPLPQCYHGYYYHHHYPPPPPMVIYDEPSPCPVMYLL